MSLSSLDVRVCFGPHTTLRQSFFLQALGDLERSGTVYNIRCKDSTSVRLLGSYANVTLVIVSGKKYQLFHMSIVYVLVIPCNFCVYGQYTTSARRARGGVLGHRHKIAWDK